MVCRFVWTKRPSDEGVSSSCSAIACFVGGHTLCATCPAAWPQRTATRLAAGSANGFCACARPFFCTERRAFARNGCATLGGNGCTTVLACLGCTTVVCLGLRGGKVPGPGPEEAPKGVRVRDPLGVHAAACAAGEAAAAGAAAGGACGGARVFGMVLGMVFNGCCGVQRGRVNVCM